MDTLNIILHITLVLISFTVAFLGVVILFSVDVWLGFTMAVMGLALSVKIMERS